MTNETQPVVVTAIFTPLEGRKNDLSAALVASIPAVHDEEGCILYAIHDSEDGTITMLEKWSSRDALAAHAAGAPVAALNAAIEGLVAGPTIVTLMDPIPAGTDAQGLL